MQWIRHDVLSGRLMAGTFLNTGSSVNAEIAAQAGFDWVLVDLEHGALDQDRLIGVLQAVSGTPAAPLVRVAWNDPVRCKRSLDAGAVGLMIPWINTAEEARQAARATRYPPAGIRGVAGSPRAAGYGQRFREYLAEANDHVLTIAQIETSEALKNADEIAAVEGIDVLFVGPTDLTVSMGIPLQYDHPQLADALQRIVAACGRHGKAAGILASTQEQVAAYHAWGFTMIGLGSDGTTLAAAMRNLAGGFSKLR